MKHTTTAEKAPKAEHTGNLYLSSRRRRKKPEEKEQREEQRKKK